MSRTTCYPDLLTPEWEVFTADRAPDPSDDFTISRSTDGVPALLKNLFADVVQAERLREVRALVGFTRLDAPDPEDPDLVARVSCREATQAGCRRARCAARASSCACPRSCCGTGRHGSSRLAAMRQHARRTGGSGQTATPTGSQGDSTRCDGWPGERYIALHTLSHLLIRTIALECGYSAASLSERIYAGTRG